MLFKKYKPMYLEGSKTYDYVNGHYPIYYKYDNGKGRIVPSLSIHSTDDEKAKNTILSPMLEKMTGFIPLPGGIVDTNRLSSYGIKPAKSRLETVNQIIESKKLTEDQKQLLISKTGEGITLPRSINKPFQDGKGNNFLSDIAKAAYRVISYSVGYAYVTNSNRIKEEEIEWRAERELERLQSAVDTYVNVLAGKLVGKRGIVRSVLYPRQSFSGFAVMTNHVEADLNEVFIPYKVLRWWLKTPEIRAKLHLTEEFQEVLVNEQLDHFFRHQPILLTGMPDHDHNCVFQMKIRGWNQESLGLHPVIATTMGRDFDGDQMFFKIFKNEKADDELSKFSVNEHIKTIDARLSKIYKPLQGKAKNLEQLQKLVRQQEAKVCFQSTTLETAAKIEYISDEKKRLFENLIVGLSENELEEAQAESAIDFSIVKFGTANGGDLGNMIRILASILGRTFVYLANLFYHIVAQDALDAKHGMTGLTAIISEILRVNLPEQVNEFSLCLSKLLKDDPDIVQMLTNIFYRQDGSRRAPNISQLYNNSTRLGSIIRGNVKSLYQGKSYGDSLQYLYKLTQ